MGSNDLHIAALVGGQPSLAENASIPQAKPVSPVLPASEAPAVFPSDSQQDRVSLSGTLPPQRQQGALASGNTQLAAFTLLAEQITFSPGQSTADVFTSSTFPAAATLAGQNSASGMVTTSASSSDAASASATSAPKSAATAQQNAAAVTQLQKLQDTRAPGGIHEASPAASSSAKPTPQGQLLNVSA